MQEWVKIIINSLKEHEISVITYIPDISIDNITKEIEADNYFNVIPATREEECIGIASGSYISGVNAAIFMQSSGFGNCINALASLNIPARIPIPMFINLRIKTKEPEVFNVLKEEIIKAFSNRLLSSTYAKEGTLVKPQRKKIELLPMKDLKGKVVIMCEDFCQNYRDNSEFYQLVLF